MTTQSPTIGRIVIYTSKNGDGVQAPAMVIRTQSTTNPEVIERWGPSPDGSPGVGRPDALVPFLTSQTHVDLVVFGLGGDYREYNIPINSGSGDSAPGTWAWPVVLR